MSEEIDACLASKDKVCLTKDVSCTHRTEDGYCRLEEDEKIKKNVNYVP